MCIFQHLFSQSQIITAKEVIAKDSIRIGGQWVSGVTGDTSLWNDSNSKIPNSKAVRDYVKKTIAAGSGAVTSVFGRTGGITAVSGDYNAGQVTNTPSGTISATSVQAAINELSTEKLQDATDAVDADNIAAGAVGASELASTAVTPGTYGGATTSPQIVIDADGRVTSATNVTITGGGGGAVPDADYGDITVSSSGTVWNIDANTVTGTEIATASIPLSDLVDTPWYSGNDGTGSGLDADLLDGQGGAFYQSASNLNTGTIPIARLPIGTANQLLRTNAGATAAEWFTPTYLTSEVDGSTSNELQTVANTSDATSHTVTLSNSGGSIQFVEGANITLTTTGTSGAGVVTIASSAASANIATPTATMNTDSLNYKVGSNTYGATAGNVVKYNFFGDVQASQGADFAKQVSMADGTLASSAGKVRWDVRQRQVAYFSPTTPTFFEEPLHMATGANYTLRITQGASSVPVYFSDVWKLSDTISIKPYSTSTLSCVWDGVQLSCNVNRHNISDLEAWLYTYRDSLDLAFVPQMLGDSYVQHYGQTPILNPVRNFGDELGGTIDNSRNVWEVYSIGSTNGTKPLVSFSSGRSCITTNTSRFGMTFKESKKIATPVTTGQFTLMGWWKVETQSALQYLFTGTNTGSQPGIGLVKESAGTNRVFFRFSTGGGYTEIYALDSFLIADGWQFIEVTGDGTNISLKYNNTTANGTVTASGSAVPTTNYAVNSFQNGAEPFKGSCAGVVLANRKLSASAIAAYKEASKKFSESGRLDVKSKVREIPNNDFDLTKVTGLLYWSAEQNIWRNTAKTLAATANNDTIRVVEPLFGKVANNEWYASTQNASVQLATNYRNGKPAMQFKNGCKLYLRGTQETSIPLVNDSYTFFIAACVTDTSTYSSLLGNDVNSEYLVSATSGGANYNMKEGQQHFLGFTGGSPFTSFSTEYHKPMAKLPTLQQCYIYEGSKADSVLDLTLSGDGHIRFGKTNSTNMNPYTLGGNGGLVGYVLGVALCKGKPDMTLRGKIRKWIGDRFAISTVQNLDVEPDNDKEDYSKKILYQDRTSQQHYNAFPRAQTVAVTGGHELRVDWQSSQYHVGVDTSYKNKMLIGRYTLDGILIDTFAPVRQGTVGDHEPYYGNATYINQDSALYVWTTRDTWGSVDSTKTYWRWIKPVSKVRYSINEFVAGSNDMPGGWAFNTDRISIINGHWYLLKYGKTLAANARYKVWLYKRTNGTGAWSLIFTLDGATMSPQQDPEEGVLKVMGNIVYLFWRDDLTGKIYQINTTNPDTWSSTTPIQVATGVSLPAPNTDGRRWVLTQRENFTNNSFATKVYYSTDKAATWQSNGYLNTYANTQLGMKDMYSESMFDPRDPRYVITVAGSDTTAGEVSSIYYWRWKFPNPLP